MIHVLQSLYYSQFIFHRLVLPDEADIGQICVLVLNRPFLFGLVLFSVTPLYISSDFPSHIRL